MMELSANGVADLSLGIIAFIASLPLFLLPFPTFWRAWKSKSTDEINLYTYAAGTIYCYLMIWYTMSYTAGDSLPIKYECLFYLSCIGVQLENIYVLLLCMFGSKLKLYTRCVIFACTYTVMGFFFLSGTWHEILISERRDDFVGPLVIILAIIMYISPLITIVHAYHKKSVEQLPFRLCTAFGLYGVTWTICALVPARFDHYFAIANGVGTILSIIQLGVSYLLLVQYRKVPATATTGYGLGSSCTTNIAPEENRQPLLSQ